RGGAGSGGDEQGRRVIAAPGGRFPCRTCIVLAFVSHRCPDDLPRRELRVVMMETLDRPAASTTDMICIPGGTFRMGSDRHYPEEAPVHSVAVDDFWIDATPATNAALRAFVAATGYVR